MTYSQFKNEKRNETNEEKNKKKNSNAEYDRKQNPNGFWLCNIKIIHFVLFVEYK